MIQAKLIHPKPSQTTRTGALFTAALFSADLGPLGWLLLGALTTSAAVGCGGSAQEAKEPSAEADAPAASAESEKPASAPADEPATESKPADGIARSVLLHEGTAFLLNHQKSDMGIKAAETCEKQAKGDVAKKANCLSKATNKMKREGFMLEATKEEDEDEEEGKPETWVYVGFNIEKGVKVETNRVNIEIGSGSGSQLTIKTVGPDRAKRRQGTVPSEITFDVPDEYTVIVNDSSRGKLVYEPKLGLFAKD